MKPDWSQGQKASENFYVANERPLSIKFELSRSNLNASPDRVGPKRWFVRRSKSYRITYLVIKFYKELISYFIKSPRWDFLMQMFWKVHKFAPSDHDPLCTVIRDTNSICMQMTCRKPTFFLSFLIISLFEFFVYFQLPDRNGVHQSSFDLILGILTRADEEDSAVSFSIRILGHGRNFHCRLIFVAFQQTLLNQHPCINVLTMMLMMMIGNFPKLHDHFE